MNSPSTELSLAQVQEYLQVIRRDKWWIYLMTVGLTLIGFVAVALLPNKYKATTSVEVDPQRVPEQFVSELVHINPADRLQTISQEVMSETRLQKIIDQWNLYPQLRQTSPREAVIEQMRSDIFIDVKQSGGGLAIFSITYIGRDPSLVASVANQLATDFIESSLKNREQQAVGTSEFLSQQLQEAKAALKEQETKVSEYKMSHLGELPQQQEALLHALSGLQMELQANMNNLDRLDEERLTLSQLPESALTSGGTAQPASERTRLEIEKGQLEARLSELRRRYTDAFPEVQEVLRRLNHVTESLNGLPADKPSEPSTSASIKPTATELRLQVIARETQRLKEEQRRIREQIAAYQTKVEAIPRREQEMTDLMRNYDISKGRYESLLNKSYAADMSNELDSQQKGERYKVLDPALIPERPFKPSRIKYMFASFFMSFFSAIGVIIVRDHLDPRVKTEREVRLAYPEPIPLLAAIPHIQSPMERRRHLQFVAFCMSASILAFGAVAAFLWRMHTIL
jgi:polysaccharide chain length determinant protein (PEP-CTERM system associated)